LTLTGGGSDAVFAHNVVEGPAAPATLQAKASVTPPAALLAGCNTKDGAELTYLDAFAAARRVECGACKDGDAACRVPGPEMFGAAAVPRPEAPVETSTGCVVGQTLTNVSLDMWKTHHCYVGVTFSGAGAVAKFSLTRMPLHLPINITFSGCTFLDGAALHFMGGRDLAESAGVLIRVHRTVMRSASVYISYALPRGTDIAVTEVDAEQISLAVGTNGLSNRFAAVALRDVLLTGASALLLRDVNLRRPRRVAGYLPSGSCLSVEESLTLLEGSALYVQHCTLAGAKSIVELRGATKLANRSVLALHNNVVLSGESILDSRDVALENLSVLRMVGNRGPVRFGVYLYGAWTARQSSWVELRDNDVEAAELLRAASAYAVDLDGSSALTLTGCKMRATGPTQALLKEGADAGHKFVAGCLTVGKELLTTEAAMTAVGIKGVTTVAQCGACEPRGLCFDALTTARNGCTCECAAGGYGDACVPSRLALPPPPPSLSLPQPPADGDCVSDMAYPEVTQTVGAGLSRLCYRNVTFSGAFMRLTVDVAAMAGEAASVTFDDCRWERGAALIIAGAANPAVGLLNIVVTRNSFEDAVLSPTGAFPPRTTISVDGNRFNVTRAIPVPGVVFDHPACLLARELTLSTRSTLLLEGNSFHTAGPDSVAVYVAEGGVAVRSHSAFAMADNTFTVTGGGGAGLHVAGGASGTAVQVRNNSVVSVARSVVSGALKSFVRFGSLSLTEKSALLLERNVGLVVRSVLHAEGAVELLDSWVWIHKNAAHDNASVVCRVGPVTTRRSRLVVSGNSVSPVRDGAGDAALLSSSSISKGDNSSVLVLACNHLAEATDATDAVPKGLGAVFSVKVESCGGKCGQAAPCFPGYTTTASGDGCACTCAEGGHGGACLPVDIPMNYEDPCVRDMNVTWEVMAGFQQSAVCYVGVTFAADVVVDVAAMSGSARNVTLANCTFVGGASLYVVGWASEPPEGLQVEVLVSGLESRSGGGVLLANRYPPGSRVTVVDSVLIAETRVAYRGAYDLGGASGCLVLYGVSLTGSVLTVARTQVVAMFGDAVGVLVVGGVALPSRGALYLDRLSVQTALGLCVSVEGGVAASGGSVLAFVDSDFLLCRHAVAVDGEVRVSGSTLAFVRSEFASTQDHAVAFSSTVHLDGGAMLLAKENVHDSASKEMLYAAGAVTANGSTLSFVRNRGLFPRMLSVELSLAAGAHLRAACNRAGGRALATADEYAAAGFGDAARLEVVGCDACDKDTYCYAPGTASASGRDGACVCACGGGGYGEACVPVGEPALPPAGVPASSVFAIENTVVQSEFVVPNGAREVRLRHVVLDGVHPVLYVPWMARGDVHIVVQNVSLRNGAVLYVMGGTVASRARAAAVARQLEVSVCSVEAFNGAIVLAGKFPAGSVMTVTDSLLITTEPTPLVYLPGSPSSPSSLYAPALVLSDLRLVNSTLAMHGVAFLAATRDGRTVVVEGAALELHGSGIALDGAAFGGDYAVHVGGRAVLAGGAVLRVSESQLHAGMGVVFAGGLAVNASAVVVNDNTGALAGDGALLVLREAASFASGSWLSVRGNAVGGGRRLLSLAPATELSQSTFALYGNTGSGGAVMDGSVAPGGAGGEFVVGCLTLNGRVLAPAEYASVGITGHTRAVACGACDASVSCFAAATKSVSGSCRCRCAEGGYGRDCLPVHLPRVDGCNRTVACPALDVSTPSGRGLTLEDIRASGADPKRLTVALPPPFRWAGDADLRPYLSFALASAAQPNGFSGPWGALLRNATWLRHAADPHRVLELTLPVLRPLLYRNGRGGRPSVHATRGARRMQRGAARGVHDCLEHAARAAAGASAAERCRRRRGGGGCGGRRRPRRPAGNSDIRHLQYDEVRAGVGA
ncbi:dispersed gene family protein 1 (DGF-1), partial [Trypanosoma conorhini]